MTITGIIVMAVTVILCVVGIIMWIRGMSQNIDRYLEREDVAAVIQAHRQKKIADEGQRLSEKAATHVWVEK